MAKEATLPKAYAYGRKIYTPEDEEIPDGLFDQLVEARVLEPDGEPAEQEGDEGLFAGLSDEQVATLTEAGYGDAESISAASTEQLDALEGIGKATIKKLQERAAG